VGSPNSDPGFGIASEYRLVIAVTISAIDLVVPIDPEKSAGPIEYAKNQSFDISYIQGRGVVLEWQADVPVTPLVGPGEPILV
jgi:hypothetical protein